MRYVFFMLIGLLGAVPAQAEDFAKILDGTSFLIPTVSEQPRGTVRTSLSIYNGYDRDGRRKEDALAFTQRFAPRWTRLQFGYAVSFLESYYEGPRFAVLFESPIGLAHDGSFFISPKLNAITSPALAAIHFSLPFSAQVWPRFRATAFTGFGYRVADNSWLKIHQRKLGIMDDCFPESEGAYVYPRGAALDYNALRKLRLSLEYARTTYYSISEVWEYGEGYVRWTEVRQSIAPGVRFKSGEWTLAAGFPFSINDKTTAEGLIFNLAFQPVGRTRK